MDLRDCVDVNTMVYKGGLAQWTSSGALMAKYLVGKSYREKNYLVGWDRPLSPALANLISAPRCNLSNRPPRSPKGKDGRTGWS